MLDKAPDGINMVDLFTTSQKKIPLISRLTGLKQVNHIDASLER